MSTTTQKDIDLVRDESARLMNKMASTEEELRASSRRFVQKAKEYKYIRYILIGVAVALFLILIIMLVARYWN
jgi:uncharacterized membrane protein YukC